MITRSQTKGGYLLYRPPVSPTQCRKEGAEQIDFVAHVREHWPEYAQLMAHPANEGQVSAYYRQQQYKMGLLVGVSDLLILRPGAWPCALLELKQCKHSARASKEQREVLEAAWLAGQFAAVCNGFEAALCAFRDYREGLTVEEIAATVQIQLIDRGVGK